jgi:hypothetical protein
MAPKHKYLYGIDLILHIAGKMKMLPNKAPVQTQTTLRFICAAQLKR